MKEKIIEKYGKDTFKDRILECLQDKKPSPWALSIGLDHGVINRIFNLGKIPTEPHLLKISENLGKSINWLLTGKETAIDKESETMYLLIQSNDELRHLIRKMVEIFVDLPEIEPF